MDDWVFTHWTFHEGDSLKSSVVRQDLKQIHLGLAKWLKAIFGANFKDMGRTFAIGQQEDGHSCGICVINSFEHELFGSALFTHGGRNILRIHYFTEAVKFLLAEVRIYFIELNELILIPMVHSPRLPTDQGQPAARLLRGQTGQIR